jgi:hypothetical protein
MVEGLFEFRRSDGGMGGGAGAARCTCRWRWILPCLWVLGFGGINGFWTPFLTFEGQILNGSNLIHRN